jgi:hypothetical protein
VSVFFSKQKVAAEAVPLSTQERRRSIRHATVMQVAKIRFGSGREELCMLRDVSPEGLRVEIYVPIEAGTHIELELRTGHQLGGSVVWAENKAIGVAFDEPMPMSAMLAHCSFDDRLGKLRPPRLTVNMRGLLKIGGEDQRVEIGNISQAGMQIAAPEPLHEGAACAIGLPGLPPRAATIRWCREGQAGLMLDEPFDFPAFAEWRALVAA